MAKSAVSALFAFAALEKGTHIIADVFLYCCLVKIVITKTMKNLPLHVFFSVVMGSSIVAVVDTVVEVEIAVEADIAAEVDTAAG